MAERLPINKASPKKTATVTALDRLRQAWREADEFERAAFRVYVLEQETTDGR